MLREEIAFLFQTFSRSDPPGKAALTRGRYVFQKKKKKKEKKRKKIEIAAVQKKANLVELENCSLFLFSFFLFFFFSFFFSFFLKDITAPRQRGLSRKVVSGKGLKQRSEFFAMDKKVPAFFMQKCRVNLCAAEVGVDFV